MINLKAPFPWFGGKSRVAPVVWEAFGDCLNYVEPFAGSLAVLLGRPSPPRIETANDRDGFISNVWRAIAFAPDEVAHWADWPVHECDLHARHAWLQKRRVVLSRQLEGDPLYYDAQIAGWWLWGISCWIGGGWCAEGAAGPWRVVRTPEGGDQLLRNHDGVLGVRRRIPSIGAGGSRGVTRQIPALGKGRDVGVHRQRPHLGGAGGGTGLHAGESACLAAWMHELRTRLRDVRICCGDWARVVTPTVTYHHGITGVFLDPPYAHAMRDQVYGIEEDCGDAVRRWALANGDNPLLRIALCGYAGEHDMPASWRAYHWQAPGGMAAAGTRARANAGRERIWFSPHCLAPTRQMAMFPA